MATIRENQRVDEEFHEQTPQEFADEPDRTFTKVSAPGSDDAPGAQDASEGEKSGEEEADGEDGKATRDE
jgi:hypothetical protein